MDFLKEQIDTIIIVGSILGIYLSTKKHILRVNRFMMKMLFEIIDILDGKDINGQVKALRKEAEKFNVDN